MHTTEQETEVQEPIDGAIYNCELDSLSCKIICF